MEWARIPAYFTGMVGQELLPRNEDVQTELGGDPKISVSDSFVAIIFARVRAQINIKLLCHCDRAVLHLRKKRIGVGLGE
jgi:hypothetical protein